MRFDRPPTVSPYGSALGIATLATFATEGRLSAIGAYGIRDFCETGVAAGACVSVVAEFAGRCPAISASLVRASKQIGCPFYDCLGFDPRSAPHHSSGCQRHKRSMLFEDAQRSPGLWAFPERLWAEPHPIPRGDFAMHSAFQQPPSQSFGPVNLSRYRRNACNP